MRIRIIIGSVLWVAALLTLLLHPADAHAAAGAGVHPKTEPAVTAE